MTSSRIGQAGSESAFKDSSVTVDTISLDEYFDGDAFTFLKVDIEGSESAMLDGAANSIRKWRPRMALSVYHYPIDIFELPKKCAELNPDYRFSISHHSSLLMETVLYCKDKSD